MKLATVAEGHPSLPNVVYSLISPPKIIIE
jgi:hypothetical protein